MASDRIGGLQVLFTIRRNALSAFPKRCLDEPVVRLRAAGRPLALVTAPDAIGHMMITHADDSRLPWICYEVGFARGRRLRPKIFVFGTIEPKDIAYPLAGIQFVGTWDTNRWKMELLAMGVTNIDEKEPELAALFRQ